jgi:hypothetical protein
MQNLKKTIHEFFKDEDTKREIKETMYPIVQIIYNEVYIYIWLICIYNIFLFVIICIILLLLLEIFRKISAK